MRYLNYLVQGGNTLYKPMKDYLTQMEEAERQQRRFLAKAVELGCTVFEEMVSFPGTPEEQAAKLKELWRSMEEPDAPTGH